MDILQYDNVHQHINIKSQKVELKSKGCCQILHSSCQTVVKSVLFVSPVGPLGACGMINGKSYNLGYVQSSPQAAEDGSISIVYQSGDRCGPTSHYSTRIILQCDDNPVSIPAPTRSPFPPSSAANCFHRSFLTQSAAQQDLSGIH